MSAKRDVLGNLPTTRSTRRSTKRGAPAGEDGATQAEPPPMATPKVRKAAAKPQPADRTTTSRKPRVAPPAKSAATSPEPSPEPSGSSGGLDVLGTAENLAKAGLRLASPVLRRLPRL